MEITTIYNEVTKSISVKDFEKQVEDCNKWLESIANENHVILNDLDLKKVKEQRAENNTKRKNLATLRKNVILAYVGQFEEQMFELEHKLNDREKELKKLVDNYEEAKTKKEETAKGSTKVYKVTCCSLSKEDIEALITYAKRKKIQCSDIIED